MMIKGKDDDGDDIDMMMGEEALLLQNQTDLCYSLKRRPTYEN